MRKLRNILNHVLDVLAGVSFLAMLAGLHQIHSEKSIFLV